MGSEMCIRDRLRPAQRRDRQPAEQLHTESRPPLSAFGLPRILRLPALLAGQRISPEPRKRADRLVAAQDYHGFRISAASARGDSASISVKFALHAVYSYFGCAVDTPLGKMQTSLLLHSLIRIFDFVEDTLVRQCSNKFDIALAYPYLCRSMNRMIDIFSVLGHRLAAFGKTPDTVEVVRRAAVENPWFLPQEIIRAVKAIRCEMLERQRLEAWAGAYPPVRTPKRVLVVMAGNIPLVGFFDLLCVLASGHACRVKPSSKDTVLILSLIHISEPTRP